MCTVGARGFMSTQSVINKSNTTVISTASWVQTAGAMAFGVLILFAVGFAPMDVAHNAAHDPRHTLAFPCH